MTTSPVYTKLPAINTDRRYPDGKHKNIQRNDDSVQNGGTPDPLAATRNSVADPCFSSRRAIAPAQNYDRLAGSHFYFGGKEQTPALQRIKVKTKSDYQSKNRVVTRSRYRQKNRVNTSFHDGEGGNGRSQTEAIWESHNR
jgi:hypothetical protein